MHHRPLLLACLSIWILGSCTATWAAGPFQGSFSIVTVQDRGKPSERVWTQGYTFKQVGSLVCGEWYYWTPTQQYEGLVIGTVSGRVLNATICQDHEPRCSGASEVAAKTGQQFVSHRNSLEELATVAGEKSLFYKRHLPASVSWSTYTAAEAASFLEGCKESGP